MKKLLVVLLVLAMLLSISACKGTGNNDQTNDLRATTNKTIRMMWRSRSFPSKMLTATTASRLRMTLTVPMTRMMLPMRRIRDTRTTLTRIRRPPISATQM